MTHQEILNRTSAIASRTLMFGGVALLLALSACGHRPGDRALSGGAIGAGAGAVISGVTGGNPLTGALIGGAVGAVGGAATSSHDVNLGRPAWR